MYINKGFERNYEILQEAKRRLELWLKRMSWYDFCWNSRLEFEFSLGLYEFPYKKEKWMGEDFNQFITEDENDSDVVQFILDKLFYEQYLLNTKKSKLDIQSMHNVDGKTIVVLKSIEPSFK